MTAYFTALKQGVAALTLGLFITPLYANSPLQTYSYGAELLTEGNAPFYRIHLPQEIYRQTIWPDLRDIQVFNRHGQPVAMALQPITAAEKTITEVPLTLYSMRSESSSTRNGMRSITVISDKNIKINIDESSYSDQSISYLVQYPTNQSRPEDVRSQLELLWPETTSNWEAKITVYSSNDLHSWSAINANQTIMDLHSGSDRLLLNQISLPSNYRKYYKNWLIVITPPANTKLPPLTSVKMIETKEIVTQQMVKLPFDLISHTDSQAEYTLPFPQPLSALQIELKQANIVMPLVISYTNDRNIDNKTRWQPLTKTILYQLYDDTAEPVSLPHKQLITGIRLQALNTAWGEDIPTLSGQRERVDILFNSGNNGPFILAWGAQKASSSTLTVESLIPETLRINDRINKLPIATLGEKIPLKQKANNSQSPQWLLWTALILGALGLLFMAFKLGKELFSTKLDQ